MNARAAIAVGVGLLVVGGAVALFAGVGPVSDHDRASGAEITDFPTATGSPIDPGGGVTDGSTATGTDDGPRFTLFIDRIEECGTTCRDVTVTLTNEQNRTASDVMVYTRIYVGNSTAEDDLAWEGTEPVGRMEPNGTHTATKRIQLSYGESLAIKGNGGWITVQTTVQSAESTVTFEDRRNVA